MERPLQYSKAASWRIHLFCVIPEHTSRAGERTDRAAFLCDLEILTVRTTHTIRVFPRGCELPSPGGVGAELAEPTSQGHCSTNYVMSKALIILEICFFTQGNCLPVCCLQQNRPSTQRLKSGLFVFLILTPGYAPSILEREEGSGGRGENHRPVPHPSMCPD